MWELFGHVKWSWMLMLVLVVVAIEPITRHSR